MSTDITSRKVQITKNYTNTTKATHGYTIKLTNGAKAENIYVADRLEISYTAGTTSVEPVQLSFRNFQTKIRFGFYETVPGYKVQITGVKYNNASDVQTTFGVDGEFVTSPTGNDELTYTVNYESDANGAKPVVTIDKTATSATKKYETFGTYVFGKDLGTTSNTNVIYDQENGAYKQILPNTGNETPMTFTVSYKLISEDTQEVIEVADRQVTVPAAYCQWKPNFAYTYLFKISDQSAQLYPITFDAVVVDSQIGNQETITEVSEPSITTYAVKSDGTTLVTDQEEYQGGNFIYASVVDKTVTESSKLSGNTVILTSGSNVNLYTITSTKGSKASVAPDITEKAVANCIANGVKDESSNPTTWTTTDVNESELKATKATGTVVTTVPAEDKTNHTMSALKWTATADTYYAVEYINGDTKTYKIVKVGAAE